MALWELVAWASLLLGSLRAFNVDMEHARVIADPNMQPGSYFGYTLALRRDNLGSWLLVGAPRANSTYPVHRKFHQPGVVYQCSVLGSKDCTRLTLDPTDEITENEGTDKAIQHLKNNSWVGGALAVQQQKTGVVVCGSRWKNQYYKKPQYYLQNGVCYWLPNTQDPEATAQIMLPLIERMKQGKGNSFNYAYGQAGFSVHITQDESEVLIGDPGVLDWKGSVSRYKVSKNTNLVDEMHPQTPSPDSVISGINDTYLGYSVSSGKLSPNRTLYVSGSPRAADLKGKVIIFEIVVEDYVPTYKIYAQKEGTVYGEYFGASVCVIDLNSDGLDDLLVGAPLHLPSDAGRMYVFLNNPKTGLQEIGDNNKIDGSGQPWARFGTAIAVLGDLNVDGFPDIAVGAPYEDDGHGAVYIYLGSRSRTGLRSKYSQRIAASVISPALKGFGISISHGFDIDDNHYNDLAIGAYASSHAVILRSSPVVTVHAKLESPGSIALKSDHFVVWACLSYTSPHPPATLNIKVELQSDPTYGRANFITFEGAVISMHSYVATLVPDVTSCTNHTVSILTSVTDHYKPIEMVLQWAIMNQQNPSNQKSARITNDNFCKECPVVDPEQKPVYKRLVPYAIGCKDVEKCITDLKVHVALVNITDTIVLGTTKKITLKISVINVGEPAFLTQVSISLPTGTPINRIQSTCREVSSSEISCDIGNPLLPDKEESIDLHLDVRKTTSTRKFIFNATVLSRGEDKTPEDNTATAEVTLRTVADVILSGRSSHEQIFYNVNDSTIEDETELAKKRTIVHNYQVVNQGPSPLNGIILELKLPVALQLKERTVKLFRTIDTKASLDGQIMQCAISGGNLEIEDDKESDEDDERELLRRRKREVKEKSTATKIASNRFEADCENADVTCMSVQCTIGFMQPTSSRALTALRVQLGTKDLGSLIDEGGSILVKTFGKIILPDDILSPGKSVKTLELQSLILGDTVKREVKQWVIIIAAVSGVLIFLLIVLGLVKAGFFERGKRKQLQAMKQRSLVVYEDEVDS